MPRKLVLCSKCQLILERRGRLRIRFINKDPQVTFDGRTLDPIEFSEKRRCSWCGSMTRNVWRLHTEGRDTRLAGIHKENSRILSGAL